LKQHNGNSCGRNASKATTSKREPREKDTATVVLTNHHLEGLYRRTCEIYTQRAAIDCEMQKLLSAATKQMAIVMPHEPAMTLHEVRIKSLLGLVPAFAQQPFEQHDRDD
jgi:hypothetical protein